MSVVKLPQPILITGCARSGSSMVAGVLQLCGAFGGKMSGADNSRGVFENDAIHDKIVVPYLESLRVDTAGQFPLPNTRDLIIPVDWASRVFQAIRDDGYEHGPWMYKGSKACLMWPVWNYAFQNAKWIIVRRRAGDIIKSCFNTTFMNAFENLENRRVAGVSNELAGWKFWVRFHEAKFVEMLQEGLNCKVIWPERMVYGDYTQIHETIEWLGLRWNHEVVHFIDPKLWTVRGYKIEDKRGGNNGQ